MASVACVGCGALFEDREGPTHRYMESSPGCWALYGEVVAREYLDFLAYGALHRLTVDTYAAQHPGLLSPQSIQSVALHLMSLSLVLVLASRNDSRLARPVHRFVSSGTILLSRAPLHQRGAPSIVLNAATAPPVSAGATWAP